MFAIVFRSARLVVALPSRSAWSTAVGALTPFEDESAHTADEYAAVAQGIRGQEMSIEAAQEAGLLNEYGDATCNSRVYHAP